MSIATHTPGPWQAGRNYKGKFSNEVVVRPKGEFPHGNWVCDCGHDGDPDAVANAFLIAAAPDLLEACRAASQTIAAGCPDEDGEIRNEFIKAKEKLDAAIAKAKVKVLF